MPKRSSRPRIEGEDFNDTAFRTLQEVIRKHDPESKKKKKNPAAVSLGRLGGKKGGKARAASLSPERRKEIARQAAAKRWSDRPDK